MVRVMATWPSDVLGFCVLEQEDFVYAVRLTLEDPTARLHCFLYGEDAVRLLGPDEDSKKICFFRVSSIRVLSEWCRLWLL
jgi:hypothetical protein